MQSAAAAIGGEQVHTQGQRHFSREHAAELQRKFEKLSNVFGVGTAEELVAKVLFFHGSSASEKELALHAEIEAAKEKQAALQVTPAETHSDAPPVPHHPANPPWDPLQELMIHQQRELQGVRLLGGGGEGSSAGFVIYTPRGGNLMSYGGDDEIVALGDAAKASARRATLSGRQAASAERLLVEASSATAGLLSMTQCMATAKGKKVAAAAASAEASDAEDNEDDDEDDSPRFRKRAVYGGRIEAPARPAALAPEETPVALDRLSERLLSVTSEFGLAAAAAGAVPSAYDEALLHGHVARELEADVGPPDYMIPSWSSRPTTRGTRPSTVNTGPPPTPGAPPPTLGAGLTPGVGGGSFQPLPMAGGIIHTIAGPPPNLGSGLSMMTMPKARATKGVGRMMSPIDSDLHSNSSQQSTARGRGPNKRGAAMGNGKTGAGGSRSSGLLPHLPPAHETGSRSMAPRSSSLKHFAAEDASRAIFAQLSSGSLHGGFLGHLGGGSSVESVVELQLAMRNDPGSSNVRIPLDASPTRHRYMNYSLAEEDEDDADDSVDSDDDGVARRPAAGATARAGGARKK